MSKFPHLVHALLLTKLNLYVNIFLNHTYLNTNKMYYVHNKYINMPFLNSTI